MAYSSSIGGFRPFTSGTSGIAAPGQNQGVFTFGGAQAAGWPAGNPWIDQSFGTVQPSNNFIRPGGPYHADLTPYQRVYYGYGNPYAGNVSSGGSSGGSSAPAPTPFKNPLGEAPTVNKPGLNSSIGNIDYNQYTQQAINNTLAEGAEANNPAEMISKITGERGISGTSGAILSDVMGRSMSGMAGAHEQAGNIAMMDPLEKAKFLSRLGIAQADDAFRGANLDLQKQGLNVSNYGQQQGLLLQLLGLLGSYG